ncbi:MAG: hypothetical protein RKO24_11455 [Candidatus Competibacter sp.]|nr:hypothetical protein [Candidatus Competibacter sp.]
MYADPRHLRDHEIKVRLNEDAYQVVIALARFNRQQPAVFTRELLLAGIDRLMQQHEAAAPRMEGRN